MPPQEPKTRTKEILSAWERETETLTAHFVERYLNCPTDVFWVADEVGGVLAVDDYFFSLQDIVDFTRYDYSPKDMFAYYEYRLDLLCGKDPEQTPINIKNWLKLK